jgi:cellulose synthase operon protein YhjQ
MDSRGTDKTDDLAAAETPEDVAVLYSWANLHGAKYRDFSASRREYRAQLRHRAAEQVRQQALTAQAEAETAALEAETVARKAAEAARTSKPEESDSSIQRSLREAEEAARTAAAERVEAARRAEAAAVAEAAARREEREIAEAHASAQRQAARYADSEVRRRASAGAQPEPSRVPGEISDPYTTAATAHHAEVVASRLAPVHEEPASYAPVPVHPDQRFTAPTQRRPRGYRPDDASGVRQIYRDPEIDAPQTQYNAPNPTKSPVSPPIRPTATEETRPIPSKSIYSPRVSASVGENAPISAGQRRTDSPPPTAVRSESPSPVLTERFRPAKDSPSFETQKQSPHTSPTSGQPPQTSILPSITTRPLSPFSQAPVAPDQSRGRRAQDDFDYQQSPVPSDLLRRQTSDSDSGLSSSQRAAQSSDPAGPAWLYAPSATPQPTPRPIASPAPIPQSSVADTLQHSRERVAARWFALKGVFEQPGQDQVEPAPLRQKETRTPVLAVFSLAGGVGKTSLVATLGRALSSMGEKVLLTDTTSHGLLPFYFGASELRQGTVRTFSPPSGSTDAPIYLVSYEVDQKTEDEQSQDQLVEEIVNNSRGTHRILLDLNVSTSWIIRSMSRMNPTVLVPVGPDMNSVISLQAVEKFFSGVHDGDGRPLQPYYVLNQFDTSLPLHLDIREVMRRQLGDRLLPFVIRRAPAVSEALAEGMTVVDYAPDAPVAADYLNLATWLRTVAAPATAGFRNVRWSER